MALVQFQIIQSDDDVYKIALRINTSNGDLEVAHTKILDLKSEAISTLFRLGQPCGVEFEDLTVTASDECIERVKAKMAEEAAAAKAAADAETPAPTAVEGELVQ